MRSEVDWLGTGWQVWLVAQDQFGNSQPSATALNLTTAAAVAAPMLLEGTQPSQVSLCLCVSKGLPNCPRSSTKAS